MARLPRILIPQAYYFVQVRTVPGVKSFNDEDDGAVFLDILGNACRRYRVSCLGYHLSASGYQLLVNPEGATLSQLMRQVQGVYTQSYNQKYNQIGKIFTDRYQALIVAPTSLSDLMIDLAMAPVREKSVYQWRYWKWGVAAIILQKSYCPGWVNPAQIQDHLPLSFSELAAMMDLQNPAELRTENQVLDRAFIGPASFVDEVRSRLLKPETKAEKKSSILMLKSGTVWNKGAKKKAVKLFESGEYSMRSIAKHFQVNVSTVSRAVKRNERES